MKLTKFRFFKNTPLIDFQNTIHFGSNAERDDFFLNGNHYDELSIQQENFNFIRDRSTLDIHIDYNEMRGVNYATFKSDFESTRYYAYVMGYEYLGDYNGKATVRVTLLIDAIMTFTQGKRLESLTNLEVMREHFPEWKYNGQLDYLKNNHDILKTHTKKYFHERSFRFSATSVLILSSVDLEKPFGTVDDPKISTSGGVVYDDITSPLNIYAISLSDFNTFMSILSDYPWITQNFKRFMLLPDQFFTTSIEPVEMPDLSFYEGLYKVVNNGKSSFTEFSDDLNFHLRLTSEDMNALFRVTKKRHEHLIRSEYTTTEVYTYDGQQLFIDNGQLFEGDLQFKALGVIGHHNEVAVYVDKYKSDAFSTVPKGSFLNDAIFFTNFDEIPVLTDNYTLALSKNANRRELAESKLASNRLETVMDKDADLKDRFFDGASLLSNFSISSLFGKFTDEHEFYRQQKAELADLALETPTISNQTTDNGLAIKNDFYGLRLLLSRPSNSEWQKLIKYYEMFGYEVNEQNSRLSSVESNTICNYVQFKGSWHFPDVDVALIEMMKAQFENGVRLWHNNNTPNPMNQNVLNNDWRN